MQKLLTLIQTLDNLSRIPRTGGVLFAGIDPNRTDSIAEHSYKVANICLLLGKTAQTNGLKINMEQLLETALTHDWSDMILLDIPTGSPSYKSYFNEQYRDITKQGEQKAKDAISEYIKDITELDLSSTKLSPAEESIIKSADVIALLIEILEWKYQGLQYEWFDFLWSNTLNRLRDSLTDELKFLSPLVDELDQAYQKGFKSPNPFLTKPEFQSYKK